MFVGVGVIAKVNIPKGKFLSNIQENCWMSLLLLKEMTIMMKRVLVLLSSISNQYLGKLCGENQFRFFKPFIFHFLNLRVNWVETR